MFPRTHIARVAGMALSGVALLFLIAYLFSQYSHADLRSSAEVVQALSALPVRLTIPAIKVDAAIGPVGLTPSGAMDTPKGPDGVGWLNLGPRPGENGSAVIDGHFGWKDGIPAVFDDLYALRAGDLIYVKDENGTITTFVVRELRTYGEHDSAAEVFSSDDGRSHLNLITCEGTWNPISRSYAGRLVVFADKR